MEWFTNAKTVFSEKQPDLMLFDSYSWERGKNGEQDILRPFGQMMDFGLFEAQSLGIKHIHTMYKSRLFT